MFPKLDWNSEVPVRGVWRELEDIPSSAGQGLVEGPGEKWC